MYRWGDSRKDREKKKMMTRGNPGGKSREKEKPK